MAALLVLIIFIIEIFFMGNRYSQFNIIAGRLPRSTVVLRLFQSISKPVRHPHYLVPHADVPLVVLPLLPLFPSRMKG